MAKTQHLALSRIGERALIYETTDASERLFFTGSRNRAFQFKIYVKVVFYCPLTAPSNKTNICQTSIGRLFYTVLDQRLV